MGENNQRGSWKNLEGRLDKKLENIDKKTLLWGLVGISPFPIIGEFGAYKLIDSILENHSAFSQPARGLIALCTGILVRAYSIYPLYAGIYHAIHN